MYIVVSVNSGSHVVHYFNTESELKAHIKNTPKASNRRIFEADEIEASVEVVFKPKDEPVTSTAAAVTTYETYEWVPR